MNVATC